MRLQTLGAFGAVLFRAAAAAACSSGGTEIVQSFPTSGGAVSEWKLCWRVERMPDELGALAASETLVISDASFRPGAAAAPVAVLGDLRMAEIFVPYDSGEPRFSDLTGYAFDLHQLSPVECSGTRLASNKVCRELLDRELAWLYSDLAVGRRGEKLVLWSVLDAGNYDYVMYYAFWDDGTIEVRAGSTGQKLGGEDDTAGHSHLFAWRIDLDIAGAGGDSVHLENVRYTGKSVQAKSREVTREGGIAWSPESFTHVEVEDHGSVNGRGRARAYALAPAREGLPKFVESWTRHPIWVTRGRGPGQELRAIDLPRYADQESVAGEDVVLWYLDTHHHEENMRDEDRDTVPVLWIGFRLEPRNFWDDTPFYP